MFKPTPRRYQYKITFREGLTKGTVYLFALDEEQVRIMFKEMRKTAKILSVEQIL